jgi:hypothetical protein
MDMIFCTFMINSGCHFNIIARLRIKCKSYALALWAMAARINHEWAEDYVQCSSVLLFTAIKTNTQDICTWPPCCYFTLFLILPVQKLHTFPKSAKCTFQEFEINGSSVTPVLILCAVKCRLLENNGTVVLSNDKTYLLGY